MRLDDGSFQPLNDGDPVSLEFPTQGGHVLYVAARIQNLAGRHALLLARLRDVATDFIVAQDGRNVDFVVDAGGWGQPDLSDPANVANVPACPDYQAKNIVGESWVLEVVVTDSRDAGAALRQTVVPTCLQPDGGALQQCLCECAANYFLGKCGVDAGIPDAGRDGG